MAITGRMLVSAIQAIVDVDTRNKRMELSRRMADHTLSLAERLNLGERERASLSGRAHQMFDAFRRADMQAVRMRETSAREDHLPGRNPAQLSFAEALGRWGEFDEELVDLIYRESFETYQELKSELFASRSQAAHVSAVLRPFQRKYFEIWQQTQLNGLNFEEEARAIHALTERQIASTIDLSIWARDSYDTFYRLAVVQSDLDHESGTRLGGTSPKPLGAIRASSERTYRQQWFAWMKRNDQRVIDQLEGSKATYVNMTGFDGAYIDSVSAPVSSFSNIESVVAPVPVSSSVVPAVEMSQSAAISVRLVNLEDQSLFADRTWNKSADALQQVGPWIATLERLWGKSAHQVLTTLEIDLSDGATKLNLPHQGLDTLAQVVRDAIDSLT